MALKTKEPNEEPVVEQISFDDLEFDAEYVDEEEMSTKKYYTISGKESQYEPEWEKMKASELDIDDEFDGRPEINIFENDDKTYNALRVRVMDDGSILDLYVNYPKKDWPYVKNINKGFDFYRPLFDFIYSILKFRDERNVVDKNGEEINKFKQVNIETFAKYVDQMTRVWVQVTEGNVDSDSNSQMIHKMMME